MQIFVGCYATFYAKLAEGKGKRRKKNRQGNKIKKGKKTEVGPNFYVCIVGWGRRDYGFIGSFKLFLLFLIPHVDSAEGRKKNGWGYYALISAETGQGLLCKGRSGWDGLDQVNASPCQGCQVGYFIAIFFGYERLRLRLVL